MRNSRYKPPSTLTVPLYLLKMQGIFWFSWKNLGNGRKTLKNTKFCQGLSHLLLLTSLCVFIVWGVVCHFEHIGQYSESASTLATVLYIETGVSTYIMIIYAYQAFATTPTYAKKSIEWLFYIQQKYNLPRISIYNDLSILYLIIHVMYSPVVLIVRFVIYQREIVPW